MRLVKNFQLQRILHFGCHGFEVRLSLLFDLALSDSGFVFFLVAWLIEGMKTQKSHSCLENVLSQRNDTSLLPSAESSMQR